MIKKLIQQTFDRMLKTDQGSPEVPDFVMNAPMDHKMEAMAETLSDVFKKAGFVLVVRNDEAENSPSAKNACVVSNVHRDTLHHIMSQLAAQTQPEQFEEGHLPTNAEISAAVVVLQRACYGAAQKAGWWVTTDGQDVADNPYAFSNKLMLTVSELAEAMEGDRKNLSDDKLPHRPMREVECADALIRLFDMGGGFDMDLAGAVTEKLAFNAAREDHKMDNRQQSGGKAY